MTGTPTVAAKEKLPAIKHPQPVNFRHKETYADKALFRYGCANVGFQVSLISQISERLPQTALSKKRTDPLWQG